VGLLTVTLNGAILRSVAMASTAHDLEKFISKSPSSETVEIKVDGVAAVYHHFTHCSEHVLAVSLLS
jgi:hypothetical protein